MKLDTLEPDFKAIMEQILTETSQSTGLTWVCYCGRRTMAEQAALYEQGRTKPGKKVTKAPPGSSAHNYGLGSDCGPLMRDSQHNIWWKAPDSAWEEFGRICEKHGMVWGGHFKSLTDKPHCEHPRWQIERKKWRNGQT